MKEDLQYVTAIRRDAAVISLAAGQNNQRAKSGAEGSRKKGCMGESRP